METAASLKLTVTHLFDAVRSSGRARSDEEAAKAAEGDLEADLNRLESYFEELSNLISTVKGDPKDAFKDLSAQMESFLAMAKAQAREKLQRKSKEAVEGFRRTASAERDKAVKSLEAYLAASPLPLIESSVGVSFVDGVYQAKSAYEAEGGMKYDFRLASQNSKLFHRPLTLSQLGYELKIPVRFSKALLGKSRVPGYERLDQYLLVDAETSGERIRAGFQKQGNGAELKVTASGTDGNGFLGIEYSDETQAVNVMNDPALGAYVDLQGVRRAMGDLVSELEELAKSKVALVRLTTNGNHRLEEVDCLTVLKAVLAVMGPSYRTLLKQIASDIPTQADEVSVDFVRERLKVLGDAAGTAASVLGL